MRIKRTYTRIEHELMCLHVTDAKRFASTPWPGSPKIIHEENYYLPVYSSNWALRATWRKLLIKRRKLLFTSIQLKLSVESHVKKIIIYKKKIIIYQYTAQTERWEPRESRPNTRIRPSNFRLLTLETRRIHWLENLKCQYSYAF